MQVQHVRWLAADVFVIRTDRPDEAIEAGQCFSVGGAKLSVNREYSIASDAGADYLDFLVRRIEGGLVTQFLASRKPGDYVQIMGPYGEFTISEEQRSSRLLFVATGTGIAPFVSFAKTFPDLSYTVFHGVRFSDERYGVEFFPQDSYRAFVSKPARRHGVRVIQGLEEINRHEFGAIYLCGNRAMITDAVEVLRSRGIARGTIFMEAFF